MKPVITLIISFLLFTNCFLYSQNYYVDYVGGSDSNSGISESTAFKHCPGDPSANGTAAGVTLQPGDFVTFKGGINYLGQVLVNVSGTSSNYITYRGSSTWGSGRAIFDMQNVRSYGFKSTSAKHYIRIENIEFWNYNYGGDHVFQANGASTYWRIDNCVVAFMENHLSDNSHGIFQARAGQSYMYFTNSEFFGNGHYTFDLQVGHHIYIQNNNFGGTGRGPDSTGHFSVAVRGAGVYNELHHIYVQDNIFHDNWQYGGDVNPELSHSPDVIHLYRPDHRSGRGPRNIWVERNYFYNDHQFSTGSGTGDMSISSEVDSIWVRNNIFVNTAQWWGAVIHVVNYADYIWIENNTFIMRTYNNPSEVYGIKIFQTGTGQPAGDNIYIYNNIFYNEDPNGGGNGITMHNSNGSDFGGECDYNTYYNVTNTPVSYGSQLTLAQWQAKGYGAHSTFDTDGSNIFTNFPANPENSSRGDYSLNPAYAGDQIDKGIPRNGYNDSYDGTLRPQGNGWDIGAFEIQTGPDVTSPRLQGANIDNPTQVTLFFSEALESQSVQNTANYIINNGIVVQNALLTGNNRQVVLTTSEHTSTNNYTVTVNNVTDLAGNFIDPQANSAQYIFEVDVTPPELQGAYAINTTQVTLFFSEALDSQSAQNVSNYNINSGISVFDAVLNSNNTDVTLTTSDHDTILTYTATVGNITDPSGNLISPNNNSADYQLIITSGPIFPIDLFGTPESEKIVTVNLSLPGNIPDLLTYHLIAFDADHGGSDSPEGHAFINDNGPLELFPDATQTNGDGQTNTFAFTLPSSWLVNGVNELKFVRLYSTGYRIDSAFVSLDGSTDVLGEDIPNDFTLNQNYPNPFNPSTSISFSLPVDSKVRLSVYNLLGEMVKELANDEFSAGTLTFSFNADGLTSGVYFYRLEAGTFIHTRKMTLLR